MANGLSLDSRGRRSTKSLDYRGRRVFYSLSEAPMQIAPETLRRVRTLLDKEPTRRL